MSAGVPVGWPEFDHDVMGYAQITGYSLVSGPPKAELKRTLGGPDRPRIRRKNAGAVVQVQWLMTNAQLQALRSFWVNEIGTGEYPFAMRLLIRENLEWWACRFLQEYTRSTVSDTDWTVSGNLYLGYMPDWQLKPGAGPMPLQTNVSEGLEPNPPGALQQGTGCAGFYQGQVTDPDIFEAPSDLIASGGLATYTGDVLFAPVGVEFLDSCPV